MSITFAPATRNRAVLELHDGPTWEHLKVNVSNANAARVLSALGFVENPDDPFGECAAELFLGRVLLAEALEPLDEGMPAYELAPRVYDCGRSAGYLQFRLGDLRTLADYCARHGYLVAWG